MTLFLTKKFKPKKLSIAEVRGKILSTLQAEGRFGISLHEKTIEHWDVPPEFDYQIGFAAGDAILLIGPSGDEFAAKKWRWLNEGTEIRWAVMSEDWVSKTQPNIVGSGQGQGNVVIRGKQAMQQRNIGARPGIEPRNWTILITKSMKKKFQRNIQTAIKEGLELAVKRGKEV